VAKLTAGDGAAGDWLGFSAAVSGDTAVVGAVYADAAGHMDQGAAYVFYQNEGGPGAWGQVAKLTAADGGSADLIAYSVAVSGDTAVVGAIGVNVGGHSYRGAAYVFYRNEGGPDAWGQVAVLTAADGDDYHYFGNSVGISGDTAVVGAFYAGTSRGAAYVFYRDQGGPGAWGQVAKLTAIDGAVGDYLGVSVAISGDTAIAGADGADAGGDDNQGAAYIFERDEGGPDAWGQVAKLTALDGAAGDGLGVSVAISGDTAVAGAGGADTGQGAAYIFYRDQGGAGAWGQVARLTALDGAPGDALGVSVAASGRAVVAGAPGVDAGGSMDQGAAYIFYRDQGGAGAWGQAARLTALDGAAQDTLGVSAAISGETALVGAQGADVGTHADQGAAYVYTVLHRVYLPLVARDR
jgi:hypothetical protein